MLQFESGPASVRILFCEFLYNECVDVRRAYGLNTVRRMLSLVLREYATIPI